MLKPLLLLPAVVFLAIGAASNPSPAAQEGTAKPSKAANASAARAKEIYNFDCAICHGPNGNGKTDLAKDMQLTMTDFTDPKTFEGKTDDQLFDLIRKGKDKMPGEEEGRAKDVEVHSLILYIRNMSKGQPIPTDTPAVAPAAPPADAPAPAPPTAPSGK